VTAHRPRVGLIISFYALLDKVPPEYPRRNSSGTGAGVLLSGTSQLARRPAGTLDNNFTLLAHEYVLCA
jgi:hypothetical protein